MFVILIYRDGRQLLEVLPMSAVTQVNDISQIKSEIQAEIYFLSAKLHAVEVFGSREAAEIWLAESNPALNGDTPSHSLTSAEGLERVIDVLNAIRYGVFV